MALSKMILCVVQLMLVVQAPLVIIVGNIFKAFTYIQLPFELHFVQTRKKEPPPTPHIYRDRCSLG